MPILKYAAGVGVVVMLASQPAFAQRGNSGIHGPAAHGAPAHPVKPATAGPKGPSTQGSSGGAHAPHTPDAGTTASDKTTHGPKKTSTSTTTTNTTTPTGPVNFATTPVGQKLTRNTALQSKLTTRLQALGYQGTVFQAAYGFKNLGQFVAAVNVSRNLGIPFDQLKLQMTGLTVDAAGNITQSNTPTKSLGQAIQTLKPGVDADAAAHEATEAAESETDHDVETSTTSKTTHTNTATHRPSPKKTS